MKTSIRHLFLSTAVGLFLSFGLGSQAQEKPPVAAPAAAPAPKPEESSKLRRLDEVAVPDDSLTLHKKAHVHIEHSNGNEVVSIGHDAYLAKEHKADAVVAVFGSATSDGDVGDSVVSVLGSSRATGPVGDTVVAVFGNASASGKVGDTVVAVLGNVELGSGADVGGDVVAIGGTVRRDPKAIIHGQVHEISFGGALSDMEWLHSWIANCALYGRLLAFGPHLMWAWWFALGFLGLYVVLALLFSKGVEKCTETLEQRPGYSILAALLTTLLAPVAFILLLITGVGIVVVPFLAAGLFFAGLFGKAVMLGWLGRRIIRLFGQNNPALAVLVGGLIMLGLYTVPILGIVLYKLLGWIGLGVVIYTLLLGMKREKPAAPVASPIPPPLPVGDEPAAVGAVVPPLVAAATLPRAGFWIRIAALLLDVILLAIVLGLLLHMSHKASLLVLAGYGAVMWRLRGSTIGGIICGLKVVRLDDRELDWSTAIVRALGCFLSLVVLGLGFVWVAFDDQKQSWHDKIAGTTVVRLPKGGSLV